MPNNPKTPPPVVKKPKPYPFEATLDINGVKKPVHVLFVNKEGFLARLDKIFVKVGDHHQIQFELPLVERSVLTPVRVLKTYDKALDAKGHKVERIAEFRFEKLIEDHRAAISSFIAQTGQTK